MIFSIITSERTFTQVRSKKSMEGAISDNRAALTLLDNFENRIRPQEPIGSFPPFTHGFVDFKFCTHPDSVLFSRNAGAPVRLQAVRSKCRPFRSAADQGSRVLLSRHLSYHHGRGQRVVPGSQSKRSERVRQMNNFTIAKGITDKKLESNEFFGRSFICALK